MSEIRDVFKKTEGGVFVPYITAGYPDIETSIEIGTAIAENGGDILELGIPFSDPLADGPVIQESFQYALDHGITVDKCFKVAEGIYSRSNIPIIFMIGYNLVYQKGIRAFADLCVKHHVAGLIIPDLPPESAHEDHYIFSEQGIDMIFLIAPNTPVSRRDLIIRYSSGYLYCISRLGITGAQDSISEGLGPYLDDIRKSTDLPLCVGFGISKPEHVNEVCRTADGAIVGSAIVRLISEHMDDKAVMLKNITEYTAAMKAAADEGSGFGVQVSGNSR